MYFFKPMKISKYATSLLSYALYYLATKVAGEFKIRAYLSLSSWFPEVTVFL